MKFKSLFFLFNVSLIISFFFVFALPFFILGPSFALSFWQSNWPLALFFIIILAILNGFYFYNRPLFTLLEREDWPALAHYLEGRILDRQRFFPYLVNLLAHTYVVLSDFTGLHRLESALRQKKPRLLEKIALIFGLAYILESRHEEAISFLSRYRNNGKKAQEQWISLYYAFSLLYTRNYEKAGPVLSELCEQASEPLVVALAAYFVRQSLLVAFPAEKERWENLVTRALQRVRSMVPDRSRWERELSRNQGDLAIAILAKPLAEAALLIYT
ncbi:MAG: hypothetical protein N2509_01520 [Treponemataceae bacterium]|uniref:hypothetical protein n=1 Tax=Treponema sp. J25 TaxID=2094121 RepID=UPI00104B3F94|nr:hypothetical protein [Treponema sp. J25]MCX7948772.1 hypothetical protein [Treponemataceae bacterium]HOJ98337.1 hypothetical protein [Termitinemataceae bacterium]TCW62648.1 hypothetical protein C5O22_00925 [Treponema sp. J25]HOM22700.1 hypothetical protein [Termitinemataceae bacterium]HPP99539.1 hypothetical protein [Termitinemataceae bacterium]